MQCEGNKAQSRALESNYFHLYKSNGSYTFTHMHKHTLYTTGEEGVCIRCLHTIRGAGQNDLLSDWIAEMLQMSQKGQKQVSPEGVAPTSPREHLAVLDNAMGSTYCITLCIPTEIGNGVGDGLVVTVEE